MILDTAGLLARNLQREIHGRAILEEKDMWQWLRFFVDHLQDERQVLLPVHVPAVEDQHRFCRCGSPKAAVKVEALVDDPEQACLMTCSQDSMARAYGQMSLVTNPPIESPD